MQQFGPGDVRGHQVRRELDAVERELERAGQAGDQQGLGQAGYSHEQAVPAGEDRHEELLDDLVLTDDDLAELLDQAFVDLPKATE